MPNKLTQFDFCRTAQSLNCQVETLQAVARVESGGRGGFDEQGRLLLRFEGHHFRKYTNGKFDKSNPSVSYPYSQQKWKPHGYSAFNEAFALAPTAALLACSFGMYQVLGAHYDDLGFNTVGEFVDFLKKGEAEQLEIFVRFCRVNGLIDELRRNDFAGFARIYNGASYKDFNYDRQMQNYYLGLKAKKIDCTKLLAASAQKPKLDLTDSEIETATQTISATSNQQTSVQSPSDFPPDTKPTDQSANQSPITQADFTEGTRPTETKVEVTDGNVKVQTSETPKPAEVIAIEKPPAQNFIEKIKARISILTGGNIGIQALSDYGQQFQFLGLTSKFWLWFAIIAGAASVIYLIVAYLKHREETTRNLEITNELIKANSTDSNRVVLVDAENIEAFRAQGVKIINR